MKTLNSRLKAWLQTHRDNFDAFSEAILDMQILIMTTTAAAASYIAFLYFAYSLSHTLGIDSDHIATAMFMGLILAFVLLAFIAPFKTIFTFVVWAGCLPAAIQIPFLTQRFGDDYSRTAALGLLIIIGLYGAIRGVHAYPKMKEERARSEWLTKLVQSKYPGWRKWRAMLKADFLSISEVIALIRMRYTFINEEILEAERTRNAD